MGRRSVDVEISVSGGSEVRNVTVDGTRIDVDTRPRPQVGTWAYAVVYLGFCFGVGTGAAMIMKACGL
jgi:hypothetical protein